MLTGATGTVPEGDVLTTEPQGTRERRQTELGWELRCTCCHEFWPEDSEFFFFSKGRAHSWCKACYRANPNVVAKIDRWKEAQRKHPAREPAPSINWAPLLAVRIPAPEVRP